MFENMGVGSGGEGGRSEPVGQLATGKLITG